MRRCTKASKLEYILLEKEQESKDKPRVVDLLGLVRTMRGLWLCLEVTSFKGAHTLSLILFLLSPFPFCSFQLSQLSIFPYSLLYECIYPHINMYICVLDRLYRRYMYISLKHRRDCGVLTRAKFGIFILLFSHSHLAQLCSSVLRYVHFYVH